MNSPLGKYAAPAAAIGALGIIGAFVVTILFGHALNVDPSAEGDLRTLAFAATGALLASAVTVNGYKAPVDALTASVETNTAAVVSLRQTTAALHKRVDDAGIPAAGDGIDPAVLAHGQP